MGKYGRAAELAARLIRSGQFKNPRAAWDAAVAQLFPESESSRNKSCPRDSFLAICELGLIAPLPCGRYTRSVKNKSYVVRALEILRANPAIENDENGLWRAVVGGVKKTPNHQMEVVIAVVGRKP